MLPYEEAKLLAVVQVIQEKVPFQAESAKRTMADSFTPTALDFSADLT